MENSKKIVAIVTSMPSHFDYVVRTMQPMNKNVKFIRVSGYRDVRAIIFDMAIEYCRELWDRSLWIDYPAITSRFNSWNTEVKVISEIREPFTLYYHVNASSK